MLRLKALDTALKLSRKGFRLFSDHNGAVRVRFAPSPTGSLHIGGARTAMYNWLYAMKYKGKFIIRVEDTDQLRSTKASEHSILQDLSWLSLKWTEGPDLGGPHSPYRQSERKDIYLSAANKLIASGHAYRCFCEEEKLVQKRPEVGNFGMEAKYDGKWRDADPAEVQANLDKNMPYTVRFKVPKGKKVTLNDKVFGAVSWETDVCLDDFIILRSNGMPVYNFCVAVDDIDMRITHVIRAQEHLTNTLRQLLIMEALQVTPPEYAHCSILLGADGTKLSKRHGAASVDQFQKEGYLPLAIISYLTAFRSTDVAAKIVLTLDEIIEKFSLDSLSKGPAMFDIEKLKHFNREYLRAMSFDEIRHIVLKQISSSSELVQSDGERVLVPSILMSDSINTYETNSVVDKFITAACKIALRDMVLTVDSSHLVGKCLQFPLKETLATDAEEEALFKTESFQSVLKALVRDFESGVMPSGVEDDFDDKWKAYLKSITKEFKVKGKALYHPVRLGLTGCKTGPEVVDYVRFIGLSSESEVHKILNPDFPLVSMKGRIAVLKELLSVV